MPPNSRLGRSVSLFAVLALGGCGGGTTAPPPAVTVSISPSTVTLGAAGMQSFTATVSNATNTGVTWSASGGSIVSAGNTGMYTAPVAGGSYTVTATSLDDPSKRATADVTVTPVSVSVAPSAALLFRSQPRVFTATVTGTTESTEVTWAATCGDAVANGGTLNYTAPAEVTECAVTATSVLDPTMSGTAQVAVRGAHGVTAADDVDDGACTWDHCSLREAINAANVEPDPDTIFLEPAALAEAPAPAPSLVAQRGPARQFGGPLLFDDRPPPIEHETYMFGAGSSENTIDLNGNPGLQVNGDLWVTGTTIQNGVTSGHGGAASVGDGVHFHAADVRFVNNRAGGRGGAVYATNPQMVLDDVWFIDNETTGDAGAAIGLDGGGTFSWNGGGASGNSLPGWGGVLSADNPPSSPPGLTMDIRDVSFDGNSALVSPVGGSAIFLDGAENLTAENLTFLNNVTDGGGTVRLIDVDDYSFLDVIFDGNTANSGAAADISDSNGILINPVIRNNNAVSHAAGFHLYGSGTTTIDGGMITNSNAGSVGGTAILLQGDANLIVNPNGGSNGPFVISGNETATGPGTIALYENSQLSGWNIEVVDNMAVLGAGLFLASGNAELHDSNINDNWAEGPGGGFKIATGTFSLNRSTVSGNHSDQSWGGGGANDAGSVSIANSTFVDNSAVEGGATWGAIDFVNVIQAGNTAQERGGAHWGANGTSMFLNSTIVSNSALIEAGGIGAESGSTIEVMNAILGNNLGPGGEGGVIDNCGGSGSLVFSGVNFLDAPSCPVGGNDIVSSDLGIQLIDAEGVPVGTPLVGSPAIDAADPDKCPPTDLLGHGRLGQCDSGAIEFGADANTPVPLVVFPLHPLSATILGFPSIAPVVDFDLFGSLYTGPLGSGGIIIESQNSREGCAGAFLFGIQLVQAFSSQGPGGCDNSAAPTNLIDGPEVLFNDNRTTQVDFGGLEEPLSFASFQLDNLAGTAGVFSDVPSVDRVNRIPSNVDYVVGISSVYTFDPTVPGGWVVVERPQADNPAPTCSPGPNQLCVNNDRFLVDVFLDNGSSSGPGMVASSGEDSGAFYFFSEGNWEMLVKVLNGCGINDHFWVFAAAATNVEYTVEVTDTVANQTKSYINPLGQPAAAITDTSAFATCP